jgi:hypothetical protein
MVSTFDHRHTFMPQVSAAAVLMSAAFAVVAGRHARTVL